MSTANPAANLIGITGIARRLVIDGALTEADARKAQEEATKDRKTVPGWLMEKRLVTAAQVASANAVEFGMPLLDLSAYDLKQAPTKLVSEQTMNTHQALPLFKRGNRLYVAVADPTNMRGLDEIKFQTNLFTEAILADADQVKRGIETALTATEEFTMDGDDSEGLEDLEASAGDDDDDDSSAGGVDARGDDTPVVKFVNKMLVDAIKRGASDIHFEPFETEYRVRFRTDGILRTVSKPPLRLNPRISSRLKVMSGLDIAERRVPQDGRIKLNLSKTRAMDFRVSTCPTLFGEKIVLRVLDGGAAKLGIEMLGYEEEQKKLFLEAIENPYGMVLVTGPTGSGKTVSLYTALNILNTDARNISTVEDPVEIRVAGINQVQQNEKRGMTFSAALRSFLRQDPDVIMVGEIRDLETAEIAIKAAQTGHMVLSTLHTNDAPQTISRLMNMGIAPFNITSSVTLVIAQRLGRRLCQHCKAPLELPENALLAEGFTQEQIDAGFTLFDAVGCDQCTEGYKGRTGIYQVMPMSEEIQKIVLEGGNAMQISEAAARSGVSDLRQSALRKCAAGVMSLAEVNRVTTD